MASLVLSGDTSGSITVSAPAVAGSTTQTLVNVTGTLAPIVSGTAIATTSGTAPEFTGIPNWVTRLTLMWSGVSTNGTAVLKVQIGSGSYSTSAYSNQFWGGTAGGAVQTTGFGVATMSAGVGSTFSGVIVLVKLTGNIWAEYGNLAYTNATSVGWSSAGVSGDLGGALDRIRIIGSATGSPSDTFDAGTINILYE